MTKKRKSITEGRKVDIQLIETTRVVIIGLDYSSRFRKASSSVVCASPQFLKPKIPALVAKKGTGPRRPAVEVEIIPPLPTYTIPPIPNGDFDVWKSFLNNGGYFSITKSGTVKKVHSMSANKRNCVLQFVNPILSPTGKDPLGRRGWMNSQLRFHKSVKLLRSTFVEAPRDHWETCLPPKDKNWYEFATLLLMLCSSVIPDSRLVPAMLSIFTSNDITPEFVLQEHGKDGKYWEKRLQKLGRHVSNAENWIQAARTTIRLGRVPRNYTEIMYHYQGVGPKIALVTIQSSYGIVVSENMRW